MANITDKIASIRSALFGKDVRDEAALLKKSKRIGHMKERFEMETGYKIPLSMVYKNINKVYPKKVTEDGEQKEYNTINSDSTDEKDKQKEQSDETEEESIIEVPISDNSDSDLQIV